jgi:hypothetical protein
MSARQDNGRITVHGPCCGPVPKPKQPAPRITFGQYLMRLWAAKAMAATGDAFRQAALDREAGQ